MKSFSNGNGPAAATNGTDGPGPDDLNELWIGASDPRALAMFGLT